MPVTLEPNDLRIPPRRTAAALRHPALSLLPPAVGADPCRAPVAGECAHRRGPHHAPPGRRSLLHRKAQGGDHRPVGAGGLATAWGCRGSAMWSSSPHRPEACSCLGGRDFTCRPGGIQARQEKHDPSDEAQLCAQAICLEEMLARLDPHRLPLLRPNPPPCGRRTHRRTARPGAQMAARKCTPTSSAATRPASNRPKPAAPVRWPISACPACKKKPSRPPIYPPADRKGIEMMKKLANVLYVTTPEAYLSLDGENVVVKKDETKPPCACRCTTWKTSSASTIRESARR